MTNIHEGVFELIGFEALTPFVAYGVSRIPIEERKLIIKDYDIYLEKILD